MNTPIPNPGSIKALQLGCTCAIIDNNFGGGASGSLDGKPLFWITTGCPVHAPMVPLDVPELAVTREMEGM